MEMKEVYDINRAYLIIHNGNTYIQRKSDGGDKFNPMTLHESVICSLCESVVAKQASADATLKKVDTLLNPRQWTRPMFDQWNRALPDFQNAFDTLRIHARQVLTEEVDDAKEELRSADG